MLKIKAITPFKALDKAERHKIITVIVINSIISVTAVAMLIYYNCIGDPLNRTFNCINTALSVWLPFLAERIIRHRFSFGQHMTYVFIMLTSCLIGSCLYVFELWPPYDKLAHATSGYLLMVFILGIFANNIKDFENSNPLVMAVMMFAFSLGTACAWELIEFACDALLAQNGQGYVTDEILQEIAEKGYTGIRANIEKLKYVSVLDTDTDMGCHAVGSLIFTLHYLLHRLTKKNLFMGTMIKDSYATKMNLVSAKINTEEDTADDIK